jgi:DNA-binding FrmR family transcriptional regulator
MATQAPPTREQLVARLRRAEGQLRGVQRMLEGDAECREVLTQLAAVKAAVDQVGLLLITERLRSCVAAGEQGCADDFDAAVATFLRHATLSH